MWMLEFLIAWPKQEILRLAGGDGAGVVPETLLEDNDDDFAVWILFRCAVAAGSADELEEGKGMSDNERVIGKEAFVELAFRDEHLSWLVGDFVKMAQGYRDRRNGLLGSRDLDDSIVGQLDKAILAAESLGRLLEEELSEMLVGRQAG